MCRVLLVEDDPSMALYYECMKIWQDYNFYIAAKANHGAEALRVLEKDSFDLIFTDIDMPIMDGAELLKSIREKGLITPVIFSSSFTDFEYAQKGIIYDLFDYIVKPIDDKKLSKTLGRLRDFLDKQNDAKIDATMTALLNEMGLSEEDNFVYQIAAYCSEHYKDALSGDDFADIHGFRKDYFGKIFKQHFGITFSKFRTKVKIAYAIELIKSGAYRVNEVSDILGFSSYQYFVEKFKEVTGELPSNMKFKTNKPQGDK